MSAGQEHHGISPQKRSPGDGADVLMMLGSPNKRANIERIGGPSERKLEELFVEMMTKLFSLSAITNLFSYFYICNLKQEEA